MRWLIYEWLSRMTLVKSIWTFQSSQHHANLHLMPIRSAVTCFVSRSFGEHYFINDIILLICLIWPRLDKRKRGFGPAGAGGTEAEYFLMALLHPHPFLRPRASLTWRNVLVKRNVHLLVSLVLLCCLIPLNSITLLPCQYSLNDWFSYCAHIQQQETLMAGALIGAHMTHFKPLNHSFFFFFLNELSGLFLPNPVTKNKPP